MNTYIMTPDQIKHIAVEYGHGKGASELARELGVSRQAIAQKVERLRFYGVNIPRMGRRSIDDGTPIKKIVEELRIEHPELFV